MGYDLKYGRVTVENVRSTPIADDEPVVVFRAQDKLLPDLLEVYRALAIAAGSPPAHMDLIERAQANIAAWQAEHHTQVPGS